ncbi:hypothetical protein HWV62_42968 [Athelia sp. TMB]|nr:hypothetical protein HWV62_42968 [Athelia sp. TMB]
MVTANPLFASWSMNKFKATVINDIYLDVLFFTLIATMVVTVSEFTPHSLGISNQMLTVLGTVLGLVISFRTTSAYERYQDGRKMWSNVMVASRNIAMMIWIHVQAFSVATKHFLRSEPGIYYEDLYPLICFLPRYATLPPTPPRPEDVLPLWTASALDDPAYAPASTKVANMSSTSLDDGEKTRDGTPAPASVLNSRHHKKFEPHSVLPVFASDQPLRAARSPPSQGIWDYIGFLRPIRPLLRWIRGRHSTDLTFGGKVKKQQAVESNIPLEITLMLNTYLAWCQQQGFLTPAIASGLVTNIGNLQDTFNNLGAQRVMLQLENIENPFNYDENDLDLDHFCLVIQRELNQITAHTCPLPSSFIYSAWNQPFAPADRRTAEEIVADVEHEYHQMGPGVGLDSVRRTLLQSWRDVDLKTRKDRHSGY